MSDLLIVLDVVQIYSFDSVAEVVLVDVSIAGEIEGNGHCFRLFKAKILEVSLVIKLFLDFVENEA